MSTRDKLNDIVKENIKVILSEKSTESFDMFREISKTYDIKYSDFAFQYAKAVREIIKDNE